MAVSPLLPVVLDNSACAQDQLTATCQTESTTDRRAHRSERLGKRCPETNWRVDVLVRVLLLQGKCVQVCLDGENDFNLIATLHDDEPANRLETGRHVQLESSR